MEHGAGSTPAIIFTTPWELATALTREEARHIIDEILRSDATRQLSYDGLKALMAIARRRLARFDDD
jgi:hypothetical protein